MFSCCSITFHRDLVSQAIPYHMIYHDILFVEVCGLRQWLLYLYDIYRPYAHINKSNPMCLYFCKPKPSKWYIIFFVGCMAKPQSIIRLEGAVWNPQFPTRFLRKDSKRMVISQTWSLHLVSKETSMKNIFHKISACRLFKTCTLAAETNLAWAAWTCCKHSMTDSCVGELIWDGLSILKQFERLWVLFFIVYSSDELAELIGIVCRVVCNERPWKASILNQAFGAITKMIDPRSLVELGLMYTW